jgi:hypothetical protein
MSILSIFVYQHLMKVLEYEILKYEPSLQELVIKEAKIFVDKLLNWIKSHESLINNSKETKNEKGI